MVINREVIETRLAMLSKHVSDLTALKTTAFDAYAADHILRGYVERTLQICVQICLDVGAHLVAELELGVPTGSRDVFVILGDAGVLPADLVSNLTSMVGFRNLIVHDYARVDDRLVYAILQEHLPDFRRFAAAVVTFLDSQDT